MPEYWWKPSLDEASNIGDHFFLTGQEIETGETKETAWGLLLPQNMIDVVVEYANRKVDLSRVNSAADLLDRPTFTKPFGQVELWIFFDLLYTAWVFKSGNEDATVCLFAKDGTGRDIFRVTKSLERFLYIDAYLCYDDPSTCLVIISRLYRY
ncbi:hypothetical protein QYM36_002210 [Artemia franciscana]|uniref:Uncharacterized protein n=1 Tax=Artemia franciscana TaxID=6661 RepID=A0AA88I6U8_ARTSF|nr:hypothetical protein QYM36_002210 [Artemia franciscana]